MNNVFGEIEKQRKNLENKGNVEFSACFRESSPWKISGQKSIIKHERDEKHLSLPIKTGKLLECFPPPPLFFIYNAVQKFRSFPLKNDIIEKKFLFLIIVPLKKGQADENCWIHQLVFLFE